MRAWLCLIVVACAQRAAAPLDGGGSGSCPSGAAAVSFQRDVVPLIGHCGSELCHGGIGQSWPYASLVGAAANECSDRLLVSPGDPGASYLVQKLDGVDMCSGVRMPKQGTPLTAEQMTTITTWICQGAANN